MLFNLRIKDFTFIISKQDYIILKLIEDNSFLSQDCYLLRTIAQLAVSVIGTPYGLVNTDNNQPTDSNMNTLDNSPTSLGVINISDEPQSIVNDQPIIYNADLATGGKLPNDC